MEYTMNNLLNIKSFLKFLSRNKGYTAIDVFGLSVSLMFVILIAVYVERELNIDKQQANYDRIVAIGNEEFLESGVPVSYWLGGGGAPPAGAPRSRGQPWPSSQRSLAYSQIASESQTCTSPSCRAGTLPVGEWRPTSAANCGVSSDRRTSSKATPKWLSNSQGRSDQDE